MQETHIRKKILLVEHNQLYTFPYFIPSLASFSFSYFFFSFPVPCVIIYFWVFCSLTLRLRIIHFSLYFSLAYSVLLFLSPFCFVFPPFALLWLSCLIICLVFPQSCDVVLQTLTFWIFFFSGLVVFELFVIIVVVLLLVFCFVSNSELIAAGHTNKHYLSDSQNSIMAET